MGKSAANRKNVQKKPAARQPTRVPVLPEWAGAHGITESSWGEASRQQKERWRSEFLYVPRGQVLDQGVSEDSGSEESGEEAEVTAEHGPNYREYSITGLDLRVAQDALRFHRWEDDHCVRRLLDILELGKGCMTFMTFFSFVVDRGRL